jgi:hypothetical protein
MNRNVIPRLLLTALAACALPTGAGAQAVVRSWSAVGAQASNTLTSPLTIPVNRFAMSADSIHGLGGQVETALRRAASATGVDFSFLVQTARRESGFNAGAQASTSSAAGLFQFVEQTWLSTLKRHGASHGYGRFADAIQEGGDGRMRVEGAEARQAVMNLRYDPHAASVMAAALANDHAAYLRGRTGREPTGGELYAAHFLGPQGSAKLIQAAQYNPTAAAAAYFPDAAASNHKVFYREGRPISVAELYTNLSRTGGTGQAAGATQVNDTGDAAFAAYAGARRDEKQRQEAMLVGFLLSGDGAKAAGPFGAMYSADLLAMLQETQKDDGAKGLF